MKGGAMRKLLFVAASAIGAAVLLVPAPALAQCKPGQVMKCPEKQMAPPPYGCKCVGRSSLGSGASGGGKAEIKKKNVPTVKPNR
jgi:hypothetical protein